MAAKGTRAHALSTVPSPEQLDRERRVLELRQAGVDFATIAERVGYTHKGTAKRAYDRALARVHYPSAMEARELELTRLDRLQAAHWAAALKGDVDATDRVLRVINMRVKLLGLSHADGLAERAARVNELQAALLADTVRAALEEAGLSEEQRAAVTRAISERVSRLAPTDEADAPIEGELVDDDEGEGGDSS